MRLENSSNIYDLSFENWGVCGSFGEATGVHGEFYTTSYLSGGHLLSFESGHIEGRLHDWIRREKTGCLDVAGNATLNLHIRPSLLRAGHSLGPLHLVRHFQKKESDNIVEEIIFFAPNMKPAPLGRLQIMRSWSVKFPETTGGWIPLSYHQRRAWLDAVSHLWPQCSSPSVQRSKDCAILNGALIQDYPSLFLALGEAVNGPCGYLGKNLDAVADCIGDPHGVNIPFELRWDSYEQCRKRLVDAWARESLWSNIWAGDIVKNTENLADCLVEVLQDGGVEVIRE